MSNDVRIAHSDDDRPKSNVIVAPHTFSAFREFLAEEELRTGLCLAGQGYRQRLILPAFEVRTMPFALSTFTRIFDYDEAMICLVEEAQFRGVCVAVTPMPDGGAYLSLSGTTDEEFKSQADTSPTAGGRRRHQTGHRRTAGEKLACMAIPVVAAERVNTTSATRAGQSTPVGIGTLGPPPAS
jgi:hypothetical protein